MNYLVAATKPWNKEAFLKMTKEFNGNWYLVQEEHELNQDILKNINPKYIFFPHWSWIVPNDIIQNYECVCFHMTDLPYGRGGSPLQNLIINGKEKTKLTALKMTDELDAGPIYTQVELSLNGKAQDIYHRAAYKVYNLIKFIVENKPLPIEQEGKIVKFQRRYPEQSELPKEAKSLKEIYDHIRMLDAETYPHAFIQHDYLKIELTDATIESNKVVAKVTIREKKHE